MNTFRQPHKEKLTLDQFRDVCSYTKVKLSDSPKPKRDNLNLTRPFFRDI